MPHKIPTAAALARRLIEHGASGPDADDAIGAAQRASERLFRELRYWVGAEGARVLFRRALAQARHEHPALESIQLQMSSDAILSGLPEGAAAHGATKTVAGIEAVLVALLQLLGRLIGDDMALKFAEESLLDRARTDGSLLEKRGTR